VLVRRVGDETVFLAADGRSVHTLNTVATFIWERMDGRASLREIHAAVIAGYDVEADRAAADLRELVDRLVAAGLVSLRA
jgi:hypothetical protein